MRFKITAAERRVARRRAAALDLDYGNPPGRAPYVWDTARHHVSRWYSYRRKENRVGTVYFLAGPKPSTGKATGHVLCETEIIELNTRSPYGPNEMRIVDEHTHRELIGYFCRELLGRPPDPTIMQRARARIASSREARLVPRGPAGPHLLKPQRK